MSGKQNAGTVNEGEDQEVEELEEEWKLVAVRLRQAAGRRRRGFGRRHRRLGQENAGTVSEGQHEAVACQDYKELAEDSEQAVARSRQAGVRRGRGFGRRHSRLA